MDLFKINYREYIEADKFDLSQLYYKSRVDTFSFADIKKFHHSDFEKDTNGEWILIALKDEEIIGFISIWTLDNFIHHLYVKENFQKMSVGKGLINESLKQKLGYPVKLKCIIQNKNACGFYESLGFVIDSVGKDDLGKYNNYLLNYECHDI
jgi:ribosomal protein S18 acetylase RimI-like enzyme